MASRYSRIGTAEFGIGLARASEIVVLFFLLVLGQWVFAFIDFCFMFSEEHRRLLALPTRKLLGLTAFELLTMGCFGIIDALNWWPAIFRPFNHPAISVGVILGSLFLLSWVLIKRSRVPQSGAAQSGRSTVSSD
ncbi:MAG: hypothetical protein ACRD72_01055 [Candidatus Angelobacter sp.]